MVDPSTVASSIQYGSLRSVGRYVPTMTTAACIGRPTARGSVGSGVRARCVPTPTCSARAASSAMAASKVVTAALARAPGAVSGTELVVPVGQRPVVRVACAWTSCWMRNEITLSMGVPEVAYQSGVSMT